MKKEEIIQVYAYAENLWGSFKPAEENVKAKMQAQLWFDVLKDFSIEIIFAGMREHARKSDFANIMKIAEECKAISNLSCNRSFNEDDILQEIEKAVCSGNKIEAFNKLSPISKKVVVSPSNLASWGRCQVDTYDSVIVSSLRKSIKEQTKNFDKISNMAHECPKLTQNIEMPYLTVSNLMIDKG